MLALLQILLALTAQPPPFLEVSDTFWNVSHGTNDALGRPYSNGKAKQRTNTNALTGLETVQDFDVFGRLLNKTVTWGNDKTATWTYAPTFLDGGSVVIERGPIPGTYGIKRVTDAKGRLSFVTRVNAADAGEVAGADARRVDYTYVGERLTEVVVTVGTATTTTVYNQPDQKGRPTGQTETWADSADENADSYKYTTAFNWDAPLRPTISLEWTSTIAGVQKSGTIDSFIELDAAKQKIAEGSVVGGANVETRWLYDALGRALASKAHAQAAVRYMYKAGQQYRQEVDGHAELFVETTLDPGGLPTSRDEPLQETVFNYVDGFLDNKTVTARTRGAAGLEITKTVFDRAGRLTEKHLPGLTDMPWQYNYDALGNYTSVLAPTGDTWTYDWDIDGQMRQLIPSTGPTRTYTYDPLTRAMTTESWDIESLDADSLQVRKTTYATVGPVTTRQDFTDPDSLVNATLTTVRHADGRGRDYKTTWSRVNGAQALASPTGDITQRTSVFQPDGSPVHVAELVQDRPARTHLFDYDAAGRLLSRTEPRLDDVGGVGATLKTSYAYTAPGGVLNVTVTPPGGAAFDRVFDDLGQLRTAGNGVTLDWDLGRIETIVSPELTETWTYAPGRPNRVESITLAQGAQTTKYDYAYNLSQAGQPDNALPGDGAPWMSITMTPPGVDAVAELTEYWFDRMWRLKWAAYPDDGSGIREVHQYDLAPDGRRLTERQYHGVPSTANPGALQWTKTSTYQNWDQLGSVTKAYPAGGPANEVSQFLSDRLGRMLEYQSADGTAQRSMVWDSQGRMLSLTDSSQQVSQYAYNLADQRIWRSVKNDVGASAVESVHAWEGDGQLWESVRLGAAAATERQYTRGAGFVLKVGDVRLGHDAQGSAVLAVSGGVGTARRFDVWGGIRGGAGPGFGDVSVSYTGHAYDVESGLTYAQARYYDPNLGVFLSEDPFAGELGQPLSLGRFGYAHSNPAMYVDPDGRHACMNCGQTVPSSLFRDHEISLRRVALRAALNGGQGWNTNKQALFDRLITDKRFTGRECRGELSFGCAWSLSTLLAVVTLDEFRDAGSVEAQKEVLDTVNEVVGESSDFFDGIRPIFEGNSDTKSLAAKSAAGKDTKSVAVKDWNCTYHPDLTRRTCVVWDDASAKRLIQEYKNGNNFQRRIAAAAMAEGLHIAGITIARGVGDVAEGSAVGMLLHSFAKLRALRISRKAPKGSAPFQQHGAGVQTLVDELTYANRPGIQLKVEGGVAGAIRHTKRTNELVGGSDHIDKGRQILGKLRKLRKRITKSHSMTPDEQSTLLSTVKNHIDDLEDALK